MPLSTSDLVLYAAQHMPTDDTSQSGGAVDMTMRLIAQQMTATSYLKFTSDGQDTRQVTVTGRLANGQMNTETVNLNGTAAVYTTEQYQFLARVVLATADPQRTVTVAQANPEQVLLTIPPGEKGATALFIAARSEPEQVARYEKVFWVNRHASESLQEAVVVLRADPAEKIRIGLATTKDDAASVSNRRTAPSGITFADDNIGLPVPTGELGPGESIGVWVEQLLPAGAPPIRSNFRLRLQGVS